MRNARLWRVLLGVEKTVVEAIDLDDETGVLIAWVRSTGSMRSRCGECLRRCPGYDQGEGRRRWRTLDAGTIRVELEADAPRVSCRVHGVTVAAVPWARHQAGHTHLFDAQVAWLATQTSKSAVTQLMRIAWRTVGAIVTRVWDDKVKLHDPFADLTRIGVDEISYKRGHKYLTVIVDHDSGRLVWATPGRTRPPWAASSTRSGRNALPRSRMFPRTGPRGSPPLWPNAARTRCAALTRSMLSNGPPKPSMRCAGPHGTTPGKRHAATRQNEVVVGRPRMHGPAPTVLVLPGSRTAATRSGRTRKNLTEKQTVKLAWIVQTDPTLGRAYYLKEGLRVIFKLPIDEAIEALDKWVGWARRCRIPAFVKLQKSIVKHRTAILAAIEHGLSNGRVESMNTKIRLITRIAFGFKSPDALIALAMLSLGGHKPVLPGRT